MTLEADTAAIRDLAASSDRRVQFMEVCGTHTMAAFRTGVRSLLPANVRLISGPGCPVCVTPNGYVDRAIAIARQPGVIIATFGDMVRVPGSDGSLERARADGAEVQIVYSPVDALALAREHPDREVVFLGVGFETTTPGIAWTIRQARADGVSNYSVLCAHKTIPGAMAALLEDQEVDIQGFMCPGHVSVMIGAGAYRGLCERYRMPCVVAGFEAADMIGAIRMLLQQVQECRAEVEVGYTRSVGEDGNREAMALCAEVFESCDAVWRGVGLIPGSGLAIAEAYAEHDAARRFAGLELPEAVEHAGCRCGDVLRGVCEPAECALFGKACTPASPIGACMVSSEGSCAAHYRFGEVASSE